MCDVADQLQRAACEPPGNCGHGAGVRPGANPAGRGAAVPATQQPKTPHYQPKGDQSQATNVTGTSIILCATLRITCKKYCEIKFMRSLACHKLNL